MEKTTMGVEAVAAESAKKNVDISRKSSKVMSIEKAMGNFCKLLTNHDDRDNEVEISYTARITPDFNVEFYFFRQSSESGLNYTTYMLVRLDEKWGDEWNKSRPIDYVNVMDSRDIWALVEKFKEKIKSLPESKFSWPTTELMAAIA